jgi:arylsulfatase A-like enzyme
VLLVSIDSLRADRLGCYGNPRPTSPTVDRLAREGVLFERAVSPTSWTLPAHVTLFTGRDPHHHGVVAWQDRIPLTESLLAEVLARQGYETAGFYSGPLLHPYFGFARGFAAYVSCEPSR